MSFKYYNPNPDGKHVGDCVIRALTLLLDDTWDGIYIDLSMQGAAMHDMPNSNSVWAKYLKLNGYHQYTLPDTCPDCYTIAHFCVEHPHGKFLVATGSHVVAVVDGDYYDTSDTGQEVVTYYFGKER